MSFYLFIIAAVGAAWLGYFFWRQKIDIEISEGAEFEWSNLQNSDPEILKGYDEASFRSIYRLVHFPRFPGYALATLTAFVVSLPVTLACLSFSVWGAQEVGLLPAPVQIARHIPVGETAQAPDGFCNAECQLYVAEGYAGFYFFFGILFVWFAIVAIFMHRFHTKRPGYLREELIRHRPPSSEVEA